MEIAERLFLANSKRVSTVLRELQAFGIRLAIDDFGAGHASIGHLHRYPIHQIKIDKAFVHDVANNAGDGLHSSSSKSATRCRATTSAWPCR